MIPLHSSATENFNNFAVSFYSIMGINGGHLEKNCDYAFIRYQTQKDKFDKMERTVMETTRDRTLSS